MAGREEKKVGLYTYALLLKEKSMQMGLARSKIYKKKRLEIGRKIQSSAFLLLMLFCNLERAR